MTIETTNVVLTDFNIEENLIVKKLRSSFGSNLISVTTFNNREDEITVKIKNDNIKEIMQYLRHDAELNFVYLSDVCVVDNQDKNGEYRFDVVYHLFSINKRHRLRVKVSIREGERIESVTKIWKTADWHEREAYDLMGIIFSGHPNLKRILLPENWKGHPLRKEYPLEGVSED